MMHDPYTLEFSINYPWGKRIGKSFFWESCIDIWHKDPCKDGTDSSCGRFMRAHHGDPEVLKRIVKRYEFDWDRVFESERTVYNCGFFRPNGDPHFSVIGITLNLFSLAAGEVFKSYGDTNWKHSRKYMQEHLFEILQFAENPVDSLFTELTRKFEIGCREAQTPQRRKERIERLASIIYGYILRDLRPWYKHPRWHIWHWRIRFHLPEKLRFKKPEYGCVEASGLK